MHTLALLLAAKIDCDPRTAERLLTHGLGATRVRRIREAAPAAARSLGITLPDTSANESDPPPQAA